MSPLGTFLRGSAPKPNAATALHVTLARRLIETQGAPFVLTGEVFTGRDSALDELRYMPSQLGPCVVRVMVEGGPDEDRKALAGDWLGDPDADGRVSRLPKPQWNYSNASRAWSFARSWLEAWETCQDGRWMMNAANHMRIDRKLLVLAACACARTGLPFLPSGEERPLQAIETAERWTRGEATLEEVQDAANAADSADDDGWPAPAYGVSWASAYACKTALADDDAPNADKAIAYTATAFAHADANDLAVSSDSVLNSTLARCAEIVRGVIPTLVVLRAVAFRD